MRLVVLALVLIVAAPMAAASVSLGAGTSAPLAPQPDAGLARNAADAATDQPDPWAWLSALHEDEHYERVVGNTPGTRGLDALHSWSADSEQAGEETTTDAASAVAAPVAQPTTDYPVGWVTAFLGQPRILREADLDGDGGRDVVAGTDVGVVAVDGATAEVRWFRPIGNEVVGLEIANYDGAKGQDIAYATSWGAGMPQAAVVSGGSGIALWEVDLSSPALALGITSGDKPDLVIPTMEGVHVRLAGADGSVVWSTAVDLLPSTGAVVADLWNLGHYMAVVGDLNGDGTPDTVSAGLHFTLLWAPVAVFSWNEYTMLNAVDGATGDILWRHPIGMEPTLDFQYTVLTDLDMLDAKGDGSLDVSYTGYTLRYDAVVLILVGSEHPFLHVVDGGSTAVGVLIGARDSISPSLTWLEMYTELDHTDVDNDGHDEAVVLRESLVQSLTAGGALFLERYAFAADPTVASPMVLVSDIELPFEYGSWLSGTDRQAGARDIAVLRPFPDGAVERIAAAGTSSGRRDFAAQGARVILDIGDKTVVGTEAGLEFSDRLFASPGAQTMFFGRPMQFEIVPVPGAAVIAVRSTDHAIHVLDPNTGHRVSRTVVAGLNQLHADSHAESGLLFVGSYKYDPSTGADRRLEAWHMPDATVVWSQKLEGYDFGMPGGYLWFDGNGDGIDDALVQAGYAGAGKYSVGALNGADGSTLFDTEISGNSFFYVYDSARVRFGGHPGDDFVLGDWRYLWAFEGSTGKQLWRIELDYTPDCMTAEDFNGDGTETLHYLRYNWDDDRLVVGQVGGDGKPQESAFGGEDARWAYCNYAATTDNSVLVAYVENYGGNGKYVGGPVAFDGNGVRWNQQVELTRDVDTFAPRIVDVGAAGGGRAFGGFGEALRVLDLDDGATVVDVPLSFRPGQMRMVDLDHVGDLDFVLASPDGLVRGMGPDLQLVIPVDGGGNGTAPGAGLEDGVLPGNAIEDGTPGGGDAARPNDGGVGANDGKSSPDIQTTLVVMALFGLVARKRRQIA